MNSYVKNKTGKREVAYWFVVLLSFLVYMNPTVEVLELVIWPFMMYIGYAMGLDWASKQTDFTKGPFNGDDN